MQNSGGLDKSPRHVEEVVLWKDLSDDPVVLVLQALHIDLKRLAARRFY